MKDPLFLRFLNREVGGAELLASFAQSSDPFTADTARQALSGSGLDLTGFHQELQDATTDAIKDGVGEEFRGFVNHYMESTLEEDVQTVEGERGQDVHRTARIKDPKGPWVQALLCYNLCLYIKAFGLQDLKKCKVCSKFFCNKGQYAVYCSDGCKKASKTVPAQKAGSNV